MNINDRAEPGFRYTYTVSAEAWYSSALKRAEASQPEILVSKSPVRPAGYGGGWEFTVVDASAQLGGHGIIYVRLFEDSWQAFADVPELFEAIAEHRPKTASAFRGILDRLGFVDVTERSQP